MNKQQFIDLHGEKVWLDYCRQNSAISFEPTTPLHTIESAVHSKIIFGLKLLGFYGNSLLAAKRTIKRLRCKSKNTANTKRRRKT